MKSLCVFLSAKEIKSQGYQVAISELAQEIAIRSIKLIYGGGKLGLMGQLADETLNKNGSITGIIPRHLFAKEAHLKLSDLIITETMADRKQKMQDLADGFIICPGGLGTLEEAFAIWNAAKINLHQKFIGILNINHYYDKFIHFIDHMCKENFLHLHERNLIHIHSNATLLLNSFDYFYSQKTCFT